MECSLVVWGCLLVDEEFLGCCVMCGGSCGMFVSCQGVYVGCCGLFVS